MTNFRMAKLAIMIPLATLAAERAEANETASVRISVTVGQRFRAIQEPQGGLCMEINNGVTDTLPVWVVDGDTSLASTGKREMSVPRCAALVPSGHISAIRRELVLLRPE